MSYDTWKTTEPEETRTPPVDDEPAWTPCPTCAGDGYLDNDERPDGYRMLPNGTSQPIKVCDDCHGAGEIEAS